MGIYENILQQCISFRFSQRVKRIKNSPVVNQIISHEDNKYEERIRQQQIELKIKEEQFRKAQVIISKV